MVRKCHYSGSFYVEEWTGDCQKSNNIEIWTGGSSTCKDNKFTVDWWGYAHQSKKFALLFLYAVWDSEHVPEAINSTPTQKIL